MYQKANPLFLICETQLHAGSGDDLGIVDLPIQRERHTSFPKIEASSFKGATRESFEGYADKETDLQKLIEKHINIHKIFGYDDAFEKQSKKQEEIDKITDAVKKSDAENKNKIISEVKKAFDNNDFAGCIGFTDARLLLFPVKSMKGVFAWITCPRVLRQFEKDMKLTEGNGEFAIQNIPPVNDGEVYLVTSATNTQIDKNSNNVILEEYAFEIKNPPSGNIGTQSLGEWLAEKLFKDQNLGYWEEKIKKDILILSDNDFKDFVNLSTEVITRTKIDNATGTVATGALFTEEYLPSESILYTLVLTAPEFAKNGKGLTEIEVKDFFKEVIKAQEVIQVGGNATLGKGLIRTKFLTQNQEGGAK